MHPNTETKNPKITFEYDPQTDTVSWRFEPGFPAKDAVNSLEAAKYFFLEMQLVNAQSMMQKAPHTQQHVVGPDGMPLPP